MKNGIMKISPRRNLHYYSRGGIIFKAYINFLGGENAADVLNMHDAIYPKYDAKRHKYFYWSESNFLRKGIDKERKVC